MGPDLYAARLTQMLDLALPEAERFPVDVPRLLFEVSQMRYPDDPVLRVAGDDIPGFEGGLFPIGKPRRGWAVAYNSAIKSPGRRRFTLAHEAGHYFLHRPLLGPDGIRCGQAAVVRGEGPNIEKEADRFAACLLMPLHDFRKQLSPKQKPDLNRLTDCADRYGVSLIALVLRWLEYTERRSMVVVSRDGYARWARSSAAAFKSGRYIKTSGEPYEIPAGAVAAGEPPFEMDGQAVEHPAGVWFYEPVEETSVFSETYEESTITLLHFGEAKPRWQRADDGRPPDLIDSLKGWR